MSSLIADDGVYPPMSYETLKEYLFLGRSIVTIKSLSSGKHFTYKVKAAKDSDTVFFVSVLTGESDYAFVGTLRRGDTLTFASSPKSRFTQKDTVFQAFSFVITQMQINQRIHPAVEVRHEGTCGVCSRRLTHPESLVSGIGPDCAGKKSAKT